MSILLVSPDAHAQAVPRPKFDVASVKSNRSGCLNGRGGGSGPQPGRLSVKCIAVQDLIQAAYGTFAHGPNPDTRQLRVLGGPGWIGEDLFDVEAIPAGNATIDQMYGPMLQGLLEDRFRLKVHFETRELPVYALTTAGGGPKLARTTEGSCIPVDLSHPPPESAARQQPAFCGRTSIRRNGEKMMVDSLGATLSNFAGLTLSARIGLDRPVIDKTDLSGMFDIHLEFAPINEPDANNSTAPSLFTALQEQLGLKLSSATGASEVLVIEHIEKPLEN